MTYCSNCGSKLVRGAKYCQKCGKPVMQSNNGRKREQVFEGKVYKCPNCGEVLKSFVVNCPSCGMELRGVRATGAVREFALKLEAIEARREYTKPKGFFSKLDEKNEISRTDKQKISLIQSFSVPNTKEDMLEFMILATSNVNLKTYDSFNTDVSKSEKAISDAWIAKIKQVYDKARRSYGNSDDFFEIQELYDECNIEIKHSKKTGLKKWILLFGWIPLVFIIAFTVVFLMAPGAAEKEQARLEAIEKTAIEALEAGEYKKALLNADSLDYSPSIRGGSDADEIERQWKIKRELLIDDIIEEAAKNGVELKRPEEKKDDGSEDTSSDSGGFGKGFKEAAEPGIKEFKKALLKINEDG